jgi:uncharacterized protein (DUF302 family)
MQQVLIKNIKVGTNMSLSLTINQNGDGRQMHAMIHPSKLTLLFAPSCVN